MCGIIGYFCLGGQYNDDIPRAVKEARDLLRHRGPDDSGLHVDAKRSCVLGHRRLSIIDLSPAGHQPLANEDESVWVVFNGEIYNHLELRAELQDRGHRFRSRTDTEVLVHLYEEEGLALLNRLQGMFAFALHDARRGILLGARDPLGIKPFYYSSSARRFAFASEPKALLALPDVSAAPDQDELQSYLAFNCVPGPPTLFRDIRKLEPGTCFQVGAEVPFTVHRYWQPARCAVGTSSTEHELADELDRRLERAVKQRMLSEVPFGAMLSGGIDSSLVVGLMSRDSRSPVKSFTIGYSGDENDPGSDLVAARQVASLFGTEHHSLILADREISSVLDDLGALADDPIGAPSVTANLHAARFARSLGVVVVQVGEGADELFCGYSATHRLWKLGRRAAFMRRLLSPRMSRWLARGAAPLLERLGDPSLIGSLDGTILEHMRRHSRGEPLYWGHGTLLSPSRRRRLLGGRDSGVDPAIRLRDRLNAVGNGLTDLSYMDRLMLTDLVLGLPERLLMRVDRATMHHGVEARVPLLDTRILELALGIEPRLRAATPKGFLKRYARRLLPAQIIQRPKVGFPTARRVFLAPAVASRIGDSILDRRFLDFTGFDRPRVQALLSNRAGRDAGTFYYIWALYVLSLWYRRWVEKDG